MTDVEKIKEEIRKNVKWSKKDPPIKGGQSIGVDNRPIILTSKELELEISFGKVFYRSELKCKEFLFTLFDLALDELVK